MKILVTGGAGYIGSHVCVDLLNKGHSVIIIDNLSNSKSEVLENIEAITKKKFTFYKEDICNKNSLNKIFSENEIHAVVHLAGLKSVSDSIEDPISYYKNNVVGTLNLLDVMNKFNVKRIVFSSSATVYGDVEEVPINENAKLNPLNPYGQSKLFSEKILTDLKLADNDWSIVILRYFNPIGAHTSGLIGESSVGVPANLIPYVLKVMANELDEIKIFGDGYKTKDGTGVRDYIHVSDLSKGHIKALEKVTETKNLSIYNLGTGKGYSVMEIIKIFEKIVGKKIRYKILPPRIGDISKSYADVGKAKRDLGWVAEKSVEEMCVDSWRWQLNNSNMSLKG